MIGVKHDYKASCLEYIPPVYSDIQEFKQLSKAYNIECERLAEYLKSIHDNYFIDTLNEYGCSRWEEILNLKANASYPIEDRRFAIKVKRLGQRPYSYSKLVEMLTSLVGADGFKLNLDTSRNHLKCMIALGEKRQIGAVKDLLEKIVPLNISLEVDLLYNTHADLEKFTHADMESYTHTDLREEEL